MEKGTIIASDVRSKVTEALDRQSYSRIELGQLREQLKVLKDNQKTFRLSIEGKNYSDKSQELYFKDAIKNTEDILMPEAESELRATEDKLRAVEVKLEQYVDEQKSIMEMLEKLDSEIRELQKAAENFVEEPLDKINNQIKFKNEARIIASKNYEECSSKIVETVFAEASLKAEITRIKSEQALLKAQLETLKKETRANKFINYEKTIDDAKALDFENDIKLLEARIAVLNTDPEKLGEKIIDLIRMDGSKEEILAEYENLRMLAKGTTAGFIKEAPLGFKAVINETTLGEMRAQAEVKKAEMVLSQKNRESEMSKTKTYVSRIVSCISLINKAKVAVSQIKKALETEKKPLEISQLGRNKTKAERFIEEQGKIINETTELLVASIIYSNKELVNEQSNKFIADRLLMEIARKESGEKGLSAVSIEDKLNRVEMESAMLKKTEVVDLAPSTVDDILDDNEEEQSMLSDLSGEEYSLKRPVEVEKITPSQTIVDIQPVIPEIPKKVEEIKEPIEDLTDYDPNSLTSTEVPKIEPIKPAKPIEAPKEATPIMVEKPRVATPIVKPDSYIEEPLNKINDQVTALGGTEKDSTILNPPYPHVIDSDSVTVNNMEALKAKGLADFKAKLVVPEEIGMGVSL